jgi:hypothetical protein
MISCPCGFLVLLEGCQATRTSGQACPIGLPRQHLLAGPKEELPALEEVFKEALTDLNANVRLTVQLKVDV